MPPTPSPAPAKPAPPGRRLRDVPAAYDLDSLPIRVPPRDGEAIASWLWRVSFRYDVPVRVLLRDAGTQRPVYSTTRVASRLRNNPRLLDQLGLSVDDIDRLLTPPPLDVATQDYLKNTATHHTSTRRLVPVLHDVPYRPDPG